MKTIYFVFTLLCLTIFSSCTKEWLEEKPDKSLIIPSTLDDLQSVLDNVNDLNIGLAKGEAGTDEYFVTPDRYVVLPVTYQNVYTWNESIYDGEISVGWSRAYNRLFYANTVLEQLDRIALTNQNGVKWNTIKGSALFLRAWYHFDISAIWGSIYEKETADTDLSIQLKLNSDIYAILERSTVTETYNQILEDLEMAYELLPVVQEFPTRPSKGAAAALLARVYLTMENYSKAEEYCRLALNTHSSLINYNNVANTNNVSFQLFNEEVIFNANLESTAILSRTTTFVDSTLYQMYDESDLRKQLFFMPSSGYMTFKGSYSSSTGFFNGLATDELYLILAECRIRQNDFAEGREILDDLLATRWETNSYVPIELNTEEELLQKVLLERRKQLLFRGIRWLDLRRWNKDERFAITLTKSVNGINYTLPPNSSRYVYPIPQEEIELSGVKQNNRN